MSTADIRVLAMSAIRTPATGRWRVPIHPPSASSAPGKPSFPTRMGPFPAAGNGRLPAAASVLSLVKCQRVVVASQVGLGAMSAYAFG